MILVPAAKRGTTPSVIRLAGERRMPPPSEREARADERYSSLWRNEEMHESPSWSRWRADETAPEGRAKGKRGVGTGGDGAAGMECPLPVGEMLPCVPCGYAIGEGEEIPHSSPPESIRRSPSSPASRELPPLGEAQRAAGTYDWDGDGRLVNCSYGGDGAAGWDGAIRGSRPTRGRTDIKRTQGGRRWVGRPAGKLGKDNP